MVFNSIPHARRSYEGGAIAAIIENITGGGVDHCARADVISASLETLCALVVMVPGNECGLSFIANALVKVGLVAHVLRILTRNDIAMEPEVLRWCFESMCTIIECSSNGSSTANRIGKNDGVEMILKSMQQHSKSFELLLWATRLLYSICSENMWRYCASLLNLFFLRRPYFAHYSDLYFI